MSDEVCEVCGRQMVIKYGPHGKFQACPGFPECRNTKPYFEKIGVHCPNCGFGNHPEFDEEFDFIVKLKERFKNRKKSTN